VEEVGIPLAVHGRSLTDLRSVQATLAGSADRTDGGLMLAHALGLGQGGDELLVVITHSQGHGHAFDATNMIPTPILVARPAPRAPVLWSWGRSRARRTWRTG